MVLSCTAIVAFYFASSFPAVFFSWKKNHTCVFYLWMSLFCVTIILWRNIWIQSNPLYRWIPLMWVGQTDKLLSSMYRIILDEHVMLRCSQQLFSYFTLYGPRLFGFQYFRSPLSDGIFEKEHLNNQTFHKVCLEFL